MTFLPWENLTFQTNYTAKNIIDKINNIIESNGLFGTLLKKYDYGKPYQGKIDGNEFIIYRRIWYRNSFLPRIHGKIIEENYKTIIKINMRPHGFVIGFMIIFLGIGILAFLASLLNILVSREFHLVYLIYLFLPIFGYLLMTVPFKIESNISKKYFNELFK